MTKVDDLETYILDGKEFLSTYSIRKLLAKVEHLGFTKYACEEVLKRFRSQTDTQTDQTPKKKTIKKVHDQKSANSDTSNNEETFIEEPDELLRDISMKVLNRQRYELMKNGLIPGNQWAATLISITKENIGQSTKEGKIRSRFKSMNIKDIARILSEKPQDTLPKQDLEESS